MTNNTEDCAAEFIDGSWTYCGCRDCRDREHDDIEADAEAGYITAAEAHDRHHQVG